MGSNRQSARPGPRKSTLDTLKFAALDMAKQVYQGTGREIRGLGIAVDEDTFATASIMFVERTAEQAGGGREMVAERLATIEADGYFDGAIDDGGRKIPIRIAREDLIRG